MKVNLIFISIGKNNIKIFSFLFVTYNFLYYVLCDVYLIVCMCVYPCVCVSLAIYLWPGTQYFEKLVCTQHKSCILSNGSVPYYSSYSLFLNI